VLVQVDHDGSVVDHVHVVTRALLDVLAFRGVGDDSEDSAVEPVVHLDPVHPVGVV